MLLTLPLPLLLFVNLDEFLSDDDEGFTGDTELDLDAALDDEVDALTTRLGES